MTRENNILRIDVILEEVLAKGSLQKGIDAIEVKQVWQDVMGLGIASYTEDVVLKGQTLIVKLSSSTLKEELGYGKDKMIGMLNEVLGKNLIKSIKLV
jgi:hypothetical protein